jgi:predicted nucleic acid-binding protein
MGKIEDRLKNHAVVSLDTAVFIYHLELHPRYFSLTTPIFTWIERGQSHCVTSVITLMELTVHSWMQGRADVARQYEALLVNFPNLHVVDTSRAIARRAAQLRARYRLRPADALQAATALTEDATALITNDNQLLRLATEIEVILLDDYLEPYDPTLA